MPSGGYNKGKGKCAAWIFANVNYDGQDCLIWPFTRLVDGYGTLGYNGEMHRAHVMMCELANGLAPSPDHEAAHNCGKGHDGCIHPKHLEWKTRSDNQCDRYKHNRRTRKAQPRVKLTLEQAEEIRRLRGQETQQSLADRFGVSRPNIIMIQNGQTWNGRTPRRILTAEQVNHIRYSDVSIADLAKEFGMTEGSIYRIKNGDFYKYVPAKVACSSASREDP